MVEINFLERKKQKAFPYVLLAVFAFFLVFIGGALWMQKSNLEQTAAELEGQVQAIDPQLEAMENERVLQRSRLKLEQHLGEVEASLFPTLPLLDKMISLLPEEAYFDHYLFERGNGLSIDVQIETMEQAAAYTNALGKEAYIQTVDLTNVVEAEDETTYIASYQLQVDHHLWMEEMANEK